MALTSKKTLLLLQNGIKFFKIAIFQNADFKSIKFQEKSISIIILFIKYPIKNC